MNESQHKEKQHLARKHLFGACRELAPRMFLVQLSVGIIAIAPFLIGRFCGDGWGLFAAIITISVWLAARRLWFFSTIRFVWWIFLTALVFFGAFETIRYFRH